MSHYMEAVRKSLATLGITLPAQDQAPVLALLERVNKYDNVLVTDIANTLQQSSSVNAVIRDQIAGMEVATRYADITAQFDSIRTDAVAMVEMMKDGRLDMGEKIKLGWMKVRRGSIPDRFESIRSTYLDVAKSANDQIERETMVLTAYKDYRFALKQAEVAAQEVLAIAARELQGKKDALDAASKAVDGFVGDNQVEKAKLELSRDEAIRAVQEEDKAYQIAKDIADDLKTSYNTAEVVFARLQQTQAVKERLVQRAVTFFSTNEIVFTGLSASFTSMAGLAEATNTMEAMKSGMNEGLEALANSGGQQLEAGLRAGYGSTLKVESVQALANAVVDFQESSQQLIKELRAESSKAAADIAAAAEDGKRRFVELVNKG